VDLSASGTCIDVECRCSRRGRGRIVDQRHRRADRRRRRCARRRNAGATLCENPRHDFVAEAVMLRWVLLVVSLLAFAGATQVGTPGLLALCLFVGVVSFVTAALVFIADRVGSVQQGQGHREVGMLMTAKQLAAQGGTRPTAGVTRPQAAPPMRAPTPPVAAANPVAAAATPPDTAVEAPSPAPVAPSVPPGFPRAEPGVVPKFGPRPAAAAGAAIAPRAAPPAASTAAPGLAAKSAPRVAAAPTANAPAGARPAAAPVARPPGDPSRVS
jgi:hypothetical protein